MLRCLWRLPTDEGGDEEFADTGRAVVP